MPKDYSHLDRDVIKAQDACAILGIHYTLHRFIKLLDNPPPIDWRMGSQARYKLQDILDFKARTPDLKKQIHVFVAEANRQSSKNHKEKFELYGENVPPIITQFIKKKYLVQNHAHKYKY
jgi:hypothetical protein